MQWLIAFLVSFLLLQPVDLAPTVDHLVQPVHRECDALAPRTIYREWYQAIVCGENLPPSLGKTYFQRSGLIHVIVVSGSHLVFLEDILLFTWGAGKWRDRLKIALLLIFSIACGLQPPLVRALLQRGWRAIFSQQRRKIGAMPLQLLAGLSTVALFPGWWTSPSFLLSWLCALGLSIPLPSNHPLLRAALVYILVTPCLMNIQTAAPSSILYNVFLAPVLGFILFPMSLIAFLHPWLAQLSDFGWAWLFALFQHLPLPEPGARWTFSYLWVVLFLGVAQGLSFFFLIRGKRRQWRSFSSH